MRYAPTFFLLLHCGCGESVNNSCVMIVPISVNYFRIPYGECPFAVISALKFRKRGKCRGYIQWNLFVILHSQKPE